MSGVGGDRIAGGGGNLLPGGPGNGSSGSGSKKPQYSCYKLLVDPALVKGASKLYRFDGNVPDDPCYPPVNVRDPRSTLAMSRLWNRLEGLELPVPRFKIDSNYVGAPPPLEVTITNINDNVDKQFLKEILQKFGTMEEVFIYYHPVSKKHLGLGRIVFELTKAAKECVDKMNGRSLMGQVLEAFFDPFGAKCKSLYEDLTSEKPKPEPVKVETKISKSDTNFTAEPKTIPVTTPSQSRNDTNSSSSSQSVASYNLSHQARSNFTPSDVAFTPASDASGTYNDSLKPSAVQFTPYSGQYDAYSVYNQHYQTVGHIGTPSYGSAQPWSVQPPTPPPPPPKSNREANTSITCSDKNLDNGGFSPKMDLDTRIKMLLKGKRSSDFGKLFGLSEDESEPEHKSVRVSRKRSRVSISKNEIWGSESEEETVEDKFAKKFKRNTFVPVDEPNTLQIPLPESSCPPSRSPPPSPFLSLSKPYNNGIKSSALENELDQISDDSEGLPALDTKNEEEMSLSSLSPEDPSTIRLPPQPPPPPPPEPVAAPFTAYPPPPLPFYGNPSFAPRLPDHHLQYSSHFVFAPWHHDPAQNLHMHQQAQFFPQIHFPPAAPPPPPEPQAPVENQAPEEKDSTSTIISTVLDHLVDELKQILRRDFQRRMIENVAYKSFETWWSDNEKLQKEQLATKSTTIITEPKPEAPIFSWSASRFIETDKPAESNFSLGFKATIPKLPSFRRKIRTPSPTYMDDGRSDDSDLEGSKSSWDRARQRGRIIRNLSLSSDQSTTETSSSESSSDLDSDDDDASTLDSLESFSDKELHFSDKEESKPDIRDLLLDTESISDASAHSLSQTSTPLRSVSPEVEAEKSIDETEKVQTAVVVNGVKVETTVPSNLEEAEKEEEKIEDWEASGGLKAEVTTFLLDHSYCMKEPETPEESPVEDIDVQEPEPLAAEAAKDKELSYFPSVDDFGILKDTFLVARPPTKSSKKQAKAFKVRSEPEELDITYEFLTKGIDAEDIAYMKKSYEIMLAKDPENYWLNQTHWVDHPPTNIPSPKTRPDKRVHVTGSARTEGFYKLDHAEKQKHKLHLSLATALNHTGSVNVTGMCQDKPTGKMQMMSREARSNQRRLLTALGNEFESDLLKFNQLKFRKKSLRFARSSIHDWGLFAAEPIAADEMVIEYVGQTIRPIIADVRERKYEAVGIGSSYLFRIDLENIIDATRCGNLSRFINHSCSPNCYAKIITIEGQKKIVIYSKQQIAVNEEITYDYKFPFEEEKIVCLCGSSQCRGTLN